MTSMEKPLPSGQSAVAAFARLHHGTGSQVTSSSPMCSLGPTPELLSTDGTASLQAYSHKEDLETVKTFLLPKHSLSQSFMMFCYAPFST